MIASSFGPALLEPRLLDGQAIRVRGRHGQPVAFELDEDAGEDRARLVARRRPRDLLDGREQRRCGDRVERNVGRWEPWEVLGAVHVQSRRVTPGSDAEHALAFLVRQRHHVVGKQPAEVGQQPARNHDATVSGDVTSDSGPQRDLHVGRRQRERAFLAAEEDPTQNLHGAPRREAARDDPERGCQILRRAGGADLRRLG